MKRSPAIGFDGSEHVEGDIVTIYLISFVASFIENTKYLKKNTATLELVTCALVEGEKHYSTARL